MRSKSIALTLSVFAVAVFTAFPAFAQWSTNGSNVFYNGGNVGIGTNVPSSLLQLAGPSGVNAITLNTPGNQKFRFQSVAGVQNWGALTLNSVYNAGWFLDDTATNGWFFKIDTRDGNAATPNNGLWLYRIPNGAGAHTDESAAFGVTNGYSYIKDSLGIGTNASSVPDAKLQVVGSAHVTLNLTVDGNIAAKYQDVAEWVPVTEKMTAGTVVVLNPERENEVMTSTHSYDTAVAGVVSAQPGLVLGEPGDAKAQIATTGRVKVHVDASRHAIKIGDLLVSGEKPGTAMYSQPIDVNGHRIHQPGTVIGKALQPLASGEGDILVLLSLQ